MWTPVFCVVITFGLLNRRVRLEHCQLSVLSAGHVYAHVRYVSSWMWAGVLVMYVLYRVGFVPCVSGLRDLVHQVELQVVLLTSTKTQIPFDYYSAPYCSSDKPTKEAENLGEVCCCLQ